MFKNGLIVKNTDLNNGTIKNHNFLIFLLHMDLMSLIVD